MIFLFFYCLNEKFLYFHIVEEEYSFSFLVKVPICLKFLSCEQNLKILLLRLSSCPVCSAGLYWTRYDFPASTKLKIPIHENQFWFVHFHWNFSNLKQAGISNCFLFFSGFVSIVQLHKIANSMTLAGMKLSPNIQDVYIETSHL